MVAKQVVSFKHSPNTCSIAWTFLCIKNEMKKSESHFWREKRNIDASWTRPNYSRSSEKMTATSFEASAMKGSFTHCSILYYLSSWKKIRLQIDEIHGSTRSHQKYGHFYWNAWCRIDPPAISAELGDHFWTVSKPPCIFKVNWDIDINISCSVTIARIQHVIETWHEYEALITLLGRIPISWRNKMRWVMSFNFADILFAIFGLNSFTGSSSRWWSTCEIHQLFIRYRWVCSTRE